MMRGLTTCALLLAAGILAPQAEMIPFDEAHWDLSRGRVFEHMGRQAFAGIATLKDVDFQNGVIEVDIASPHVKTYPGILFRVQSRDDYERFYIRPHRSGHYPDALQYVPVFNRVAGWQLYHGEGCTAGIDRLPEDAWIHVRLEVSGSQARIFIGESESANLEVHHLRHGVSRGGVALFGPNDPSICYSNFSLRHDDTLVFDEPPPLVAPEGAIMEWELSRAYPSTRVNRSRYPRFYSIFYADWENVVADSTGLVDIARHRAWNRSGADLVLARKIIRSDEAQRVKFSFGYSDQIDLFLNGRKLFAASSAYQYRDPSFVGAVDLYDHAYLELEKGLNEIFMMVSEAFGGWGFMGTIEGQVTEPIRQHDRLEKAWETEAEFLTPESVLYDPKREVLYVSNFDNRFKQDATEESEFTGYISRLSLDGEITDLRWVSSLHAPCGLALRGDRLYTVERRNLTEIDIKSGDIRKRYPIPGADFPNDIDVTESGDIYITDTSSSAPLDSRIYRFHRGEVVPWERRRDIVRANGILVDGGEILFGNTGDGCLKSINLETRCVRTVTSLGAGVVDGIRKDGEGSYFVSHWEGQLYHVTSQGDVVEILDTMREKQNSADFEYIPEQRLLVIPTFVDNRVVAYRLRG